MRIPHTTVVVSAATLASKVCDIHAAMGVGVPATHDGRTVRGPWANMCGDCFQRYGVGVGLGYGQRFVLAPVVPPLPLRPPWE